MSLQLGGNGGISGCTSLHQPISNLSSLVVDGDTSISGETLFNGLTTHAVGVSVTGTYGLTVSRTPGTDYMAAIRTTSVGYRLAGFDSAGNLKNYIQHYGGRCTIVAEGDADSTDNLKVTGKYAPTTGRNGSFLVESSCQPPNPSTVSDANQIYSRLQVEAQSSNGETANYRNLIGVTSNIDVSYSANVSNLTAAFVASTTQTDDRLPALNNYGYYSDYNIHPDAGKNNYNFYAAGNAPNYFFAGLLAGSDTWDNTTNAAQLEGGRVRVAKSSGRPVTESPFEVYRQNTSGSEPYYLLMYLNGETTGVLKLNNSDQPGLHDISDYRLKSNIAELQDATSLVKQLKPCTFSIRNHNNVRGFVAHELQEIAPECVSGTKDATESIGTLIDWDGTELDTEVTEPIPEDLTYEEQVEVTPYISSSRSNLR